MSSEQLSEERLQKLIQVPAEDGEHQYDQLRPDSPADREAELIQVPALNGELQYDQLGPDSPADREASTDSSSESPQNAPLEGTTLASVDAVEGNADLRAAPEAAPEAERSAPVPSPVAVTSEETHKAPRNVGELNAFLKGNVNVFQASHSPNDAELPSALETLGAQRMSIGGEKSAEGSSVQVAAPVSTDSASVKPPSEHLTAQEGATAKSSVVAAADEKKSSEVKPKSTDAGGAGSTIKRMREPLPLPRLPSATATPTATPAAPQPPPSPLRAVSPLPEPSTPRFGTIRSQISNASTEHSSQPPSIPGRAGDPPPVAHRPLSPVIPVAKQPARLVGVITPASGEAAPSVPLSPPPSLRPKATPRSPSPPPPQPPHNLYEYETPELLIQPKLPIPMDENQHIEINPHVGIRMGSAANANDSGLFDVPNRVRQRKRRHRPHSCILVWALCAYLTLYRPKYTFGNMKFKLPKLLFNCYYNTMNYEHVLIVCTILKTSASNNSNHLGDIYNLEMPSILSFFLRFW